MKTTYFAVYESRHYGLLAELKTLKEVEHHTSDEDNMEIFCFSTTDRIGWSDGKVLSAKVDKSKLVVWDIAPCHVVLGGEKKGQPDEIQIYLQVDETKCYICDEVSSKDNQMCRGCFMVVCNKCDEDSSERLIMKWPTGETYCYKCETQCCTSCLELGGEEIEGGYAAGYCKKCDRHLCDDCDEKDTCWHCEAMFDNGL
jgi:hypothetical protein